MSRPKPSTACVEKTPPIRGESKTSPSRTVFLIVVSLVISFQRESIQAQDLVITEQVTFEDTTIVLAGDLVVEDDASLTLRGVSLRMDCQFNGQYMIRVRRGGSLYIRDNSVITANSLDNRFSFVVRGSSFEMTGSELHGAGWGDEDELNSELETGRKGLSIASDNALLEGNDFSYNHGGVILLGTGVVIRDNHFHHNDAESLYLRGASNTNVVGNSLQNEFGAGAIHAEGGHDNRYEDNQIDSIHGHGIVMRRAKDALIVGNTIRTELMAIFMLEPCEDVTVRGNEITPGEVAVEMWGWGHDVENNRISNFYGSGTGVYMIYTYNSVVQGNMFADVNVGDGIWMRHSSHNLIADNQLVGKPSDPEHRSAGIHLMLESRNNVIRENRIEGLSRGIAIAYGSNSNLILESGASLTIKNATVITGKHGVSGLHVEGDGALYITVSSNAVAESTTGIVLEWGNNLVFENAVVECDTGLVVLEEGIGNEIYQNDFVFNNVQAIDRGVTRWSHGVLGQEEVGNYWSDYTGVDNDGDGIGDTAYHIGGSVYDRFPLVSPASPSMQPRFAQVEMKAVTRDQVLATDTNVVVTAVTMQREDNDTTGVVEWVALRVDKTGSLPDGDIAAIKIWRDNNSNGSLELEMDSVIASGVFADGVSVITLDTGEIITRDPGHYLIALDFSAGRAANGLTAGIGCSDSSYVVYAFPAKARNTGFPYHSSEFVITETDDVGEVFSYGLSENYPNPANTKTRIGFSLPKPEQVSLKVRDLLGRLVRTLVDERRQAGIYSIMFDTRSLASGVYFVSLRTRDFAKTNTLVVAR